MYCNTVVPMLTIYSLCNPAVQTCSNHCLAWSEFVHGPNLVTEPCQSLLGPRNADLPSFRHIGQVARRALWHGDDLGTSLAALGCVPRGRAPASRRATFVSSAARALCSRARS